MTGRGALVWFKRGLPLTMSTGAMPQVLRSLRQEFRFSHLFSHQETGRGWSYTHDLAVAKSCRSDGVHEGSIDAERLQASCEGRNGYSMVDACMRQLRATGWLNFRMRAMRISLAAYHLWLHWREAGLFQARQFQDFEPGIRWSQMQMPSGTTGINTLRINLPAKQALDHDLQGLYVRQWVPEIGATTYPSPIVDARKAVAAAKDQLYGLRPIREAHAEADAIQYKHGSRKSGLPPRQPKSAEPTPRPMAKANCSRLGLVMPFCAFQACAMRRIEAVDAWVCA